MGYVVVMDEPVLLTFPQADIVSFAGRNWVQLNASPPARHFWS